LYSKFRYLLAGDKAIIIEIGNEINRETNLVVQKVRQRIEQEDIFEIEGVVQTYRSLSVYYDPLKKGYTDLILRLKEIEKTITNDNDNVSLQDSRIIEIPTVYGEEFGPDLNFVAKYNKLGVNEVVKIHTENIYFIYMLGYVPGFCYLGGISNKIATPRLEKPRIKVMKGSVGIAENQTGIYSMDSPGGWRIIGRTPINIYDTTKDFPVLLRPGDYIKFVKINEKQFKEIEREVKLGNYKVRICHERV